jgi:DNA-binding LacI/PurR family transcriptional regulator
VIDAHDEDNIRRAREAGLAVVMVDSWRPDAELDAVVQDGFAGGFTAAQHLAARGHRRVAWFGPTKLTIHARGRFGGAVCGLREGGVDLPPEMIVEAPHDDDTTALARRFLGRKDRPDAVLTLFQPKCAEVARVAVELGLELGRDLELVGWSAEELDDGFLSRLPEGYVPARISWSIRTMAEMALERLSARRSQPELPVVRLCVPTVLKSSSEIPKAGGAK